MSSGHLKCNRCWTKLQDHAFVTECGHIFCEQDARECFGGVVELTCPTCDNPLQARGITQVDLTNTLKKTLQLCGLPPKLILEVATRAIDFYMYHKSMEHDYKIARYERQEKDIHAMEKSYQERLLESQSKISMLSHQFESLKEERENTRKELAELKEKYAEKSRQKRKLAELYEQLKKKYGEPTTTNSSTIMPGSNFNSPRTSPSAKPSARTSTSLPFAPFGGQGPNRSSSLQPSSSTTNIRTSGVGAHDDRFNLARKSLSPPPAPRTSHPKPPVPSSPFFARRGTETPVPSVKRVRPLEMNNSTRGGSTSLSSMLSSV